MTSSKKTEASIRIARRIWANLSRQALSRLREITEQHKFSIAAGDLTYLENGWYVTHTGLLGLARRNRCAGIQVQPVRTFCDPATQRWAFRATVYKSRTCRGFVGYGDADLKEVGWTKGVELAKLARRDGQHFDCATWLHKAREMPKEEFKQEVEKELTGKETEPSEMIYFKLYKSQIPVVEQAIETAALMLGTDKSRGYCLEMICADFLAGANLENGNSRVLLQSVLRFFKFLPGEERKAFLNHFAEKVS